MIEDKIIKTLDYNIILSENIGLHIDGFIKKKNYSSLYIIMDENIMKHCWPILSKESEELRNAEILILEPGEDSKNIELAIQFWQILSEYEADRSSLIINFGGGMVSDFGGFIASTFKRGLDFINIPTSLLAMVDASIGGKTGINLMHYKNQIGVISQANSVFIYPDFLETLDPRHIKNGFAEMLKHGIINDPNHWEDLLNIKNIIPEEIIPYLETSIEIKNRIVEQDPKEKGIRKSLNFGHTIGHLIETWSLQNDEQPIFHGEAIAIGMIIESYLSTKKANLPWQDFEKIKEFISNNYSKYPINDSFVNDFKNIVNQDKKKDGKKLNFTFATKIGSVVINQDCSIEEIRESIIYYKENC